MDRRHETAEGGEESEGRAAGEGRAEASRAAFHGQYGGIASYHSPRRRNACQNPAF